MSKKGDFENPKVINGHFSAKSVPKQYGFLNSTVPWECKTVLSGDPLYYISTDQFSDLQIHHFNLSIFTFQLNSSFIPIFNLTVSYQSNFEMQFFQSGSVQVMGGISMRLLQVCIHLKLSVATGLRSEVCDIHHHIRAGAEIKNT